MALQKQTYSLSITDGLDTKTDEKNVIATRFLELENLVFTNTGSVSKRLGYTAFTRNVLNGNALDNGSALTNFGTELLAYSENDLYTFSEAEQKWVLKGPANVGVPSIESVAATGEILTNPYFENIENFSCFVYTADSQVSTAVRYKIVDRTTGTVITSALIANASRPKVAALTNKFIITFVQGGDLKYLAINSADPTDTSGPTTLLASIVEYDVRTIGSRVFALGCQATGSKIIFLQADLTVSSPLDVTLVGAQTQPNVSKIGNNSVQLAYINAGTAVNTSIFTYDLTLQSAITSTSTGEVPFSVSGVNKQTYTQFYVTYKYNAAPASQNEVQTFSVNLAGTVSAATTIISQVMAQSKAIELNGVDYFVVAKDESQSVQRTVRTYFLINSQARIIAKFDEENSVVLSKVSGVTYLTNLVVENQKLCFAGAALVEIQAEPQTAAGILITPTAVKKYCTDFAPISNFFDAKLGGNLHVTGGILKAYDGNEVVEHGFLEIPRAPVLTSLNNNGPTPGIGSTAGPSSYQYVVVYAWRDNQGQLHRSAPSPALTVAVPQVAVNYYNAILKLPTLTLTNKTNVEIELYRTEANGTNFYKVLAGGALSYTSRTFNDPTVPFLSFTDDFPDDNILDDELLYTTGGVLENVAAPASKYAVTYKNRIVLLNADGKTLYYSKLREANGPVEFNDSLFITLDDFGGPATSLAVMDDHIIIFKERALFALTGEGPNNLGEQDDFRQPYLISSDAGCIQPNSVVRTPSSIMFQSDKGIYEVLRGFAVQYIGAPVEKYNSSTISSATLLETTNEVRFTTAAGRALVYDYFHQRWTTFTNMTAQDATSYQNRYVYIRPDGTIMSETPNYYYDNGSYIKTKLVSAWISLGGIQGFERLYQMELLGNYKASHKLRVAMAYDFVDAYLHDTVINATTVLNPSFYGKDTYGTETPYGGDGLLYQFRIFPKIQKCQSFKICIEDFPGTENGGEGYTLSNIAAIVGIKTGLNKLAAQRSFGTS